MAWATRWHRHPGVRTGAQLTLGEKSADAMRNGMGSWIFVFAALGFLALWMIANSWLILGRQSFDVFPWILLNLGLSMLAALQGAILLIAAKRADQIASEVAVHTETNTEDIKGLLATNTALTEAIQKLTAEVHARVVTTG